MLEPVKLKWKEERGLWFYRPAIDSQARSSQRERPSPAYAIT